MFWTLIKYLGISLLQDLLRPTPEVQHAKAQGIESFSGITAESGRPRAVLFGTKLIRSANLLWYGNYRTLPIVSYQKIKGLFKSKTVAQIVGYRYFIGMHLSLGHAGIQTLRAIRCGDRVAWTGEAAFPGSVSVSAPALFGGTGQGGGLVGTFTIQPGGPAQGVHPYLAAAYGAPTPAFRSRSGVIFDGEIGESMNIDSLSFECTRIPNLLGEGAIGIDANPAEITYEVLRDEEFGVGAAADLVDAGVFTTRAQTLTAENFGVSFLWDSQTAIGDFLADGPLRHADAVLTPDFLTAKMAMKLIRDDYDVGDLQVFHPGNCELVEFPRASWDRCVSEVGVLFDNRGMGYTQDRATAFSQPNFGYHEGVAKSTGRSYSGLTVPALAARVAQRDLRSLGLPLRQLKLRTNRHGWRLTPGEVFILRWPPEGIEQSVFRITRVRPAPPGSPRAIEIEAVQDVFSLASTAFSTPPATEWSDPIEEPEAVALQRVEEVPYLLATANDGSLGPGAIDPEEARLLVTAARPNLSTLRAGIQTREGAAEFLERGGLEQFAPTGTLVNEYPESTDAIDESDTLIVEGLQDASLLTAATTLQVATEYRNLAMIGDELIAWETITDNEDGTYTLGRVWRGVLDTVPADHTAGDRIYFISEGMASTMDTYDLGASVDVRLIPSTPRGELDPAEADVLAHTITRRALRPIVPGDTSMNSVTWPTLVHLPDGPGSPQSAVLTGPLVVAWAHRDRLDAAGEIVPQDDPDIGPEAGTTYTVRIYDENDVLVHTEAGISGTSYTWPLATEFAETGRYNERIRATVTAVRDGLDSHQSQERTGDFGGYGMRYGENYGGAD